MQQCINVVRPGPRCNGATSPGAIAGNDHDDDRSGAGSNYSAGTIGLARCADRTLFGSTAGNDTGGFHLSLGGHPASAMDGQKQEFERQGPGRCPGQTTLGPERPVAGCDPRCCATVSGQYSMDD